MTPKHPDALELYRHSTAHLTANAVKRLFPGVKIGIGPAIENGYYYDFDPGRPFTPEDLERIEAEMRKIVAEDNEILRVEMPKSEAVKIFEAQGDPLKVEIVAGIPDDTVSCYRQADFIDLCRGPARPVDREARRLQADALRRRLLEGRRAEPDAPADLRGVVPLAEGAGRASRPGRGGEGARPPEGGEGACALPLPPVGPGLALLPPEGGDGLQPPRRLHPRALREVRLRGGHHAADLRRGAVQAVGALPELPREHVLHRDRRAGVRRQADELPGALPDVRAARLLVPRPPGPLRRLRAPPPVRDAPA